MSQFTLAEQSAVPSAPSSGKANIYVSSDADPLLIAQDDANKRNSLGGLRSNQNTADATANAADTYLAGSSIAFGVHSGLRAGTRFRWTFVMTKTAAGVATPIFNVRFGTNGTTGDAARLTYTLLAQTAAVDTGKCIIEVYVRTFSATGVIHGSVLFLHNNTVTGFSTTAQMQIQQSASAAFDATIANSIIGVSCNPGTAGVWTFQQVFVEAFNL